LSVTIEVSGFCDERFLPFKDAFRANFEAGLELGSSLAVTHRGKMVVDIWGGHADRQKTQSWQENTIVNVFSTAKIPLILTTLMLIDRGLLALDEPVARYWPEFAAGGKGAVTVRDVLTHQAGVPGFDPPVTFEALHDWSTITAHIAAEKHWFDGRRVLCYHPTTYGFLLGELMRRVDGRRPGQFLREEVTKKIGADFQFGLTSKSDIPRVAGLQFQANPLPLPPESLTARVFNSIGPGSWATWERRSADIPSSNGYGNGRSIAQICSILALGGELDGTRYVSKRMLDHAVEEQVYAKDPAFGWMRLGLGLGLHSDLYPAATPTSFHWGGYGGSWGCMDPKIALSLGYTCNNLIVDLESLDPRLKTFSDALTQLAPGL
jgi:CubicO group peptidase (beta-lactamase class C family)